MIYDSNSQYAPAYSVVLYGVSERTDEMSLRITRWFFTVVAGIAATTVSLLGWLALSLGGAIKTYLDVLSGVVPMVCLPLFIFYLWKPKAGFYSFIAYGLVEWLLLLMISKPKNMINPIDSGMDKIILLCICSVGIAYAAHRRLEVGVTNQT